MRIGFLEKAAEVDLNAEFFSGSELACHCCGGVLVSVTALNTLDALRRAAGRPLQVVSGYRCPEYNKVVGGAPLSYHMRGEAFDIACPRGEMRALVALAREVGFTGIILYPEKSFVHFDVREVPFFKIFP